MTTQAHQEEADRAELIYQYALAHIGVATVADLLSEWETLPAAKSAAVAGKWMAFLTKTVLSRRSQAQKLAMSYYRLVRALRTGTTIIDPLRDPEPEYVSLEMLRTEFALLTSDPSIKEAPREGASVEAEAEVIEERERTLDDYWAEREEPSPTELDPEPLDDDDAILTEEIARLDAQIAADEKSTLDYLDAVIAAYDEELEQRSAAIKPETPLKEAEGQRERFRVIAGSKESSTGALAAMNGARNMTFQIARSDDRVKGFVRQSSTGEPCYFCAMLISRAVLYKSAKGAGEMNDFHPNCYCVSVPVFNEAHLIQSPNFKMNAYYRKLWADNIEGKYGGDAALAEWRRLLNRMRASTTTIQVAQEAT